MWTGTPGEFRPPRYASPQRRLPSGQPYPTAGRLVARWQERNLVHGEGDALGKTVRRTMFDRYVLNRMYEYDPQTGRLLYDRVLIGVGKGNSKTELAGHIGDAELIGPIAARSPRVVVSAASYDQAREIFTASSLAITGTDDEPGPLRSYFREGDTLLDDRILDPQGPGRLERIAAVGATSDGGKPTCHIGDELHEWITERQERVWTVQSKSLRKRKAIRHTPASLGLPPGVDLHGAIQVGITTAGLSLDTMLGRLYEHGVRVATGKTDDHGFLFLWWEADADLDLDDPGELDQAILQANPNVGEFLPIENVRASYHDPTIPRIEAIRYNLNRWPTGHESLIPAGDWAACAGQTRHDPGEPMFLAIVVDHTHQHAAVAAAQRHGDTYHLRVQPFDVPDGSEDVLEVEELESHLLGFRGRFPGRVFAPVRIKGRPAERLRSVRGPLVTYHGTFFEGSAQRLRVAGMATEDQPLSRERLAPAVEALKGLVHEGQIVHDDTPETAAALANLVGVPSAKGWFPEALDPRRTIAPALASMRAVHRAMTAPRPSSRRMRIT